MSSRTDLIARLEAATEGNRELDVYILAHIEDRDVQIVDGQVLGISRNPPHDSCRLGWIDPGKQSNNFTAERAEPPYPHYTTSVDAKLPWENIVQMAWYEVVPGEALGELCEAWHLNRETDKRIMGAGNTEPLARRVAALRAHTPEETP